MCFILVRVWGCVGGEGWICSWYRCPTVERRRLCMCVCVGIGLYFSDGNVCHLRVSFENRWGNAQMDVLWTYCTCFSSVCVCMCPCLQVCPPCMCEYVALVFLRIFVVCHPPGEVHYCQWCVGVRGHPLGDFHPVQGATVQPSVWWTGHRKHWGVLQEPGETGTQTNPTSTLNSVYV